MFLGILFLLVAILCLIGMFREIRRKNFFAVGFAGITLAVFGWFAVMTIYTELFPSS
ncbi:DUF2759 domain-containing protein [Alkalihalobacillus pseudalcaliphilus]|uniref:DUF2759 domain-containing protein n=1 Tax=Alkalihalobacillus pseudalcaliphilus TaxID=79884 RepID=UPI000840C78C|nr:DUF2759 domain-containing protein [Alkalihalobacillus pseudalcaliphilus]